MIRCCIRPDCAAVRSQEHSRTDGNLFAGEPVSSTAPLEPAVWHSAFSLSGLSGSLVHPSISGRSERLGAGRPARLFPPARMANPASDQRPDLPFRSRSSNRTWLCLIPEHKSACARWVPRPLKLDFSPDAALCTVFPIQRPKSDSKFIVLFA